MYDRLGWGFLPAWNFTSKHKNLAHFTDFFNIVHEWLRFLASYLYNVNS